MPQVDASQYSKPYDGHVRFVLTHHGMRLYDEDE